MEASPRIGLIGQGWSPDVGGVEAVLAHRAATLVADGAVVHGLALDRTDARPAWSPRDLLVAGVPVRRLACPAATLRSIADDLQVPAAEEAVARWARGHALERVEVHHLSGLGTGVLRALHALGIPTEVHLHDAWTICPRGQMWRAGGGACGAARAETCASCIASTWPALEADPDQVRARLARARADLALAEALFAPAAPLAATLRAAGIEGVQVRAPEVDTAGLAEAVRRLRADRPAGLRLGVLGAVQPSKGVLELARAVVQADVEGLTLEVHGPRDDYHGDRGAVVALEALAEQHPAIRLHGPYALHQRAALLATLDAVAVPSLWEESFGLAAREARLAGLPVLATRVGGLAELVGDPGVTFLDARAPDAWAPRLRRFVDESLVGARQAAAAALR